MSKHYDYAVEVINNFANDWEMVARENKYPLCYKSYSSNPSLLSSVDEKETLGLPKVLNSLRNVEPIINVYFTR